jgi:hypothetical protein
LPTIQDFIQEIQSDDLANDVSHNLDKFMALYYVLDIPSREKIDLRVDNRNGNFGFLGLAENEEYAKSISEHLNNMSFTVYNKAIILSTKCKKNNIHIFVNKK